MQDSSLSHHEIWMQRCFDLARMAGSETKSNPHVGAVLVHNNKIIGEGYHAHYGGAHAEIAALQSVRREDRCLIPSATLYVSLEPCSHFGKTPPCIHRIIEERIPVVVFGTKDPNPEVNGKGIQFMREHGINVIGPVLERDAQSVISQFKANQRQLPYIILKWAESSDGFFSEHGKQTWLTNPYSRIATHKWRSECDAIMAGKNTVVIDNPALTVRFYHGQNPVRVIMDTSATLLSDKQIFTSKAATWIINQQLSGTVNSVEYIQVNDTGNLAEVMSLLFLRGMNTVLVEGGSKLLKAMIQWGGWHEARILVSPEKLHDGLRAPFLAGKVQSKLRLGGDLISIIKNPKVE